MINLGTIRPGRTIYIPFETFASSTGAPITLTGLTEADIKVYKDGGTTARASTTGFTLLDTDGIDFAGITGIHGVSIDLSSNATAGFWAAGSRYFVVISTVTVDGQTMSFIAATFSIGYENAILNTTISGAPASQTSFVIAAGPAENDALNGATVVFHDVASNVQWSFAEVLDYTGASKTVTLAAAPTFTIADTDNVSFFPRGNIYSVAGTPTSTVDLSTDLTEILDRLGFVLAREAGAVADAQTTAPAYAITRSGSTYTVTLAGCTSAGVRTAPTLTKT